MDLEEYIEKTAKSLVAQRLRSSAERLGFKDKDVENVLKEEGETIQHNRGEVASNG